MRRPVILLLSTVLTATPVALGVLRPPPPPAARPVPPAVPAHARPGAVGALAVLREWDDRRAAAWAAGDAGALERLYTGDSTAGAHDARMLRRWSARGLRVRDLEVQVLAVQVRAAEGDRLVLVVTDRVAGARAVGDGTDLRLPVASPATRTVELVRRSGTWRVAEVR